MAIKFFKGWKIGNNTYKVQDERADNLGTASTKNSTSVVTESSDLVESGAVKKAIVDTVGWIGENLFNSNVSLTEFVYIKDDGTTGASGDWYLTDYIEVVGGLKLIINDYAPSAVVNPSICWYTDNKTYIAGQKYNAQFPVVVDLPTNAKYVRLSIHKDRLNDITVLYPTVNETKADNSVIAPVENGSATSQAYAVGSHAIRNGAFITWKNAKSQGETINDASDYTSGDVASVLNVETDTYNNVPVVKFGNIAFLPSFADAAFFADGKTICQLGNKYKPNKVYSQSTKIFNGSSVIPCLSKTEIRCKDIFEENGEYYYINDSITTRGLGGTLNARPNLGYSIYYNPITCKTI